MMDERDVADLSIYQCKCKPLHDYILVRVVDNPNERTPGGIIIPQTAEQQPVAQVIDKGPGRKDAPSTIPEDIEVGDLVILQKYIGTKVDLNGTICMMVKYYDVQGILEFYDRHGERFRPEIPEHFFTVGESKKEESRLVR